MQTAAPEGRQKAKVISKGQRGKESGGSVKSLGLPGLQEFGSINKPFENLKSCALQLLHESNL